MAKGSHLSISVIVTTYNWPEALNLVLRALSKQTKLPFEVIIADDGSRSDTRSLIQQWTLKAPFVIKHVWQEDEGFQAAKIRNKAILAAHGNYLVFLDGDCIPPIYFIENHLKLASNNYFVAGNRLLLSEVFTKKVLANEIKVEEWSLRNWLTASLSKQCNRFLPMVRLLPFAPFLFLRKWAPLQWKGVKTCNLAVWKKDAIAVNGFDEHYIGWGFEDSDFVIRLQHNGIKHLSGRFAVPVIHCWHKEQSRMDAKKNYERLMHLRQGKVIQAEKGLSQYV